MLSTERIEVLLSKCPLVNSSGPPLNSSSFHFAFCMLRVERFVRFADTVLSALTLGRSRNSSAPTNLTNLLMSDDGFGELTLLEFFWFFNVFAPNSSVGKL